MPTIDQLNAALMKADAAGDTQNAQLFADQIKQMRGGQGAAPPAPPPTPQEAAFAAGRQAGNDEGSFVAGASQAAQQGTFGLQNYINAGARYAMQRVNGVKNPDDFDTDLAYSRGKSQGEAEGHPVASTVGGVGGALLTGGAAAKVLKLVPGGQAAARVIGPAEGQALRNVGKAAAAGGAAGGVQAKAEGQDNPQALQTAALSAVAAPIAGKVVKFGLDALQPAGRKAMQVLASTLNETPDTLQKFYDSFAKLTGRAPSMAEITQAKSQGALKHLASANPEIGNAAIKAAQMGNAPLHEQLAAVQNAEPQTESGILHFRDQDMSDAMDAAHPTTGVRLRDEPVKDPTGILTDPHVQLALRPNAQVNARLGQASPTLTNIQNGTTTVDDIETVRKALRDMQSAYSRPAPGASHMKDPTIAKQFGNVANQVESLGSNQVPGYETALAQYRHDSRYAEAFAHGLSGKEFGDIAPDSQIAPTINQIMSGGNATPAAANAVKSGYEHGNALHNAAQALNSIRPGTVAPQGVGFDASHAAQGAMAASSGGISMIYHAMRAIPGLHLPQNVQDTIAKQLFNPRTAQQGINNLRRAGVDADNLRQIVGMTGLAAGGNTGRYLSNQE